MNRGILLKLFCFFVVIIMLLSYGFAYVRVMAYQKDFSVLENKIIFIDPGHGGKDNGASVDSVLEDSINMKISGYLFEYLIDAGSIVYISRTGDYDLADIYDKNRKREDLKNRIKYMNAVKPDVFVSVHLNTYPAETVRGAQVFYKDNEDSVELAELIQKQLNGLSGKERKIKRGDYFILNNSISSGVLVECGFLSNGSEREKLNKEYYQKEIAYKIMRGIIEYFKN